MNRTPLSLVALSLVTALAVACGGSGGGSSSTPAPTGSAPKAAETSAPAASAPGTASLTADIQAVEEGDDKYRYNPATLTLKAGEVTVKLSNKAGNSRPHTFSVKNPAGGADIIRSERVQPGANGEVKFKIAEGTYDFYCSLQGHADKGQVGKLTVVKG